MESVQELKKEISDILTKNINIIDQYDLKLKKEKSKDKSKDKEKTFCIKNYLNYPLKNERIVNGPAEKELKAALNLKEMHNP